MNILQKSVVLIGASKHKGKVGNAIAKNLLKFKNSFFVNPNDKEVFGKKCYSSVLEIKNELETAVIAVKPEVVPNVLEECGKKRIKTAIIITAGFSESGEKGRIAEQKLIEISKKYNIRILGPNCFGIINPYIDLNATFASIPVNKGDIAFISQSGALCSTVLDLASQEDIGFSFFASVGNLADLNFTDFIRMLDKDEKTKAIIIYAEAFKPESGREFIEAAKLCRKPIIVLKSGISEAGAKTALTHTGSLASDYEIYKAAFREAGIIESRSITGALDKARFFSKNSLKGNGILILSNAGGPAVLAADYCEEFNVKLAEIPKTVVDSLNKVLPETWNKSNPMDIIGDADATRYEKALEKLDFNYDCLICILTPQEMSQPFETAKILLDFSIKKRKPVIAAFLGGTKISEASKLLNKNNILCFPELRRVIKVLS